LSSFIEKLKSRCERIESSLCIGLDPDPRRFPEDLDQGPEGVYRFCAEIVEATSDHAAAFKPNIAFFESIGVEGMHVLSEVLQHVKRDIPVILDAKRGDIGSTAQHYAQALFDRLKADAVTLNPLLGRDSLEPFMKYKDKGMYILCLTSNPGASDFQIPNDLYLTIAAKAKEWNEDGNLGLVVGATKPEQLAQIRAAAPGLPLLIPGLGAQGGDLNELMISAGEHARHQILFNVSRSIIYASQGKDFARAARKAAGYYQETINRAREQTLHD
jgi:orotidine-5'-phosphate decarboxylase